MSTLENPNATDETPDSKTSSASETVEESEELSVEESQERTYQDEVLEEEVALGGTPAGKATNEALRSIARTARSFLIYDTRNDAIRGFLGEMQEKLYAALKQYGEMSLEIRPFEMVRGAEVVYLERDRDRSLAFRLFRDGVRRLTIAPDVAWEEVLRLLEILSIRFTGVRQQEDDVVTLLLKSGFKSIEVSAVEGFVPDDDEYCGDDASAGAARAVRKKRRAESHIDVPRDWDLPLPELLEPVELSYQPLDSKALAELREEGSSRNLPVVTVRLLLEMLKVVNDPTDPTAPADIDGLVQEVRDFLLSESQLGSVLNLIQQVEEFVSNPDQRKELIASFTSERAVRKIISSLPKSITEPPPELIQILDMSPINHLPVLIQILNVERRQSSRSVLRSLLGRYVEAQSEKVIASLDEFEDSVALDLIDALFQKDKEYGHAIIWELRETKSAAVLHKMLNMLIELGASLKYKSWLLDLLQNTKVDGVRAKVLGLIGSLAARELFEVLEKVLLTDWNINEEEATLLGENLVKSHAGRAKVLFIDWTQSQKWYSVRRLTIRRSQQVAAIAGLSILPGEAAVERILEVRTEADGYLSEFCMKRLVVRRNLGIV
jgi:hypothetical protein